MTTLEKIRALVDDVMTIRPQEVDPASRNLIEMLTIMRGLGFDPLEALLPDSEASADQQVDGLIALLLQVRGDDLPPFDLERHIRDATATDDAAA